MSNNGLISRALLMAVPNVRKVTEYDEAGYSISYNAVPVEVIENAPSVDAAPKWISVQDDRKPKHLQEVLCTYVFDGWPEQYFAVLTFYAYGDNGYVTGMHFEGEGLHDMKVTHWMPLPEPPKEDEEQC